MTVLEEKIIELSLEGYSYKAIQLKLGNPSKEFIKTTLLTFIPERYEEINKWKHKEYSKVNKKFNG